MITEQQLSTWANVPVATRYIHTHKQIREALDKYISHVVSKNHNYSIESSDCEIYLQGSYANSTNIKVDSDVDVVIQLEKSFSYDINHLSEIEKEVFKISYDSSEYDFHKFKKDVHEVLEMYFDTSIKFDNKSLKVPANTYRVNADVVPAFKHKKYERFISLNNKSYIPGIKLFNSGTREVIINYPKEHLKNCSSLNDRTNGKFKSVVRIFKNMKKKLLQDMKIEKDSAPSYFVENLVYNSPIEIFNGSYQDMLIKIIRNWSNDIKNENIKNYECANGQDMLFSDKMWDLENTYKFIIAIADFCND
ncbi:MAG: nucleotidyltransferase [Candidatus Moranbacteria bacterium]|nr:nucleotidyltransferase [Candidatus Moranbacteria bacterium]